MSHPAGVIAVRMRNLATLCDLPLPIHEPWYGIRWVDGEIDQSVLEAHLDPYSDVDVLSQNGATYSLEFDNELLTDAVEGDDRLPRENRPCLETAVRSRIEFDACLSADGFPVGGKWTWGGMRGRPTKRQPTDFYERWRHT